MIDLIFKDECYAIQGAVFEVYREVGAGFLEAVYQECMERELRLRGIPFESQKELRISYKREPLSQTYRADFVCYEKIIVELKAVKVLAPEHRAQTLNYLKLTGLRLALLVNFASHPKAQIERLVL